MSVSKRSREGYLLIDHRNSPGLSAADQAAIDLACQGASPVDLRGGRVHEAPTFTCSHCQTIVILNPLRTRDRQWCHTCDRYLCDACGLTYKLSGGTCRSFLDVINRLQDQAGKSLNLSQV